MDVQKILESLEYITIPFPLEAVRAAIEQREEITPALLESLRNPEAILERFLDEEDYMLPFYAMFLLAQFRETRAYPLIVDVFSAPADLVDESFDDFLTEDLDRVLASVCGGDDGLIRRLVEDEDANEWVRSAALDAQLALVAAGLKSREEILAYYKGLFQGGLKREQHSLWGFLINNCCDLYPEELLEDIKQAYQDDLIEEFMVDMADVERALVIGEAAAMARLHEPPHYRLIDDTVAEMEGWPCFEPPKPSKQRMYVPGKVQKVGRNDPCPCGSGKKYKKCCGKPQ